ncbi:MAG: ferritin-like domain-containing protein [Bacillota bacterium]|nr:ferritin-like domain-containing protein [Bacillota bacterium]
MNRAKLIRWLNLFLILEKEQVELYESQSRSAEDYHLARALKRFKEIEQNHVDNITKLIKNLGGEPSRTYAAAGIAIGEGAKVAGSILASYTKVENMLQLNIMAEKKAISHYKRLINNIGDPHIKDILWTHIIDEELHMRWMDARKKELADNRSCQTAAKKEKKPGFNLNIKKVGLNLSIWPKTKKSSKRVIKKSTRFIS